jgi:hypothetical protein
VRFEDAPASLLAARDAAQAAVDRRLVFGDADPAPTP